MNYVSTVDTCGQHNAISILVRHKRVNRLTLNSCQNSSHHYDSNECQKPVNALHGQLLARRSILAACSVFVSTPSLGVLARDTRNVDSLIGPEIPHHISAYFKKAVEVIRQDIGQGKKSSRKYHNAFLD